ncbi:MAG: Asp-tRNA(Asn)/Glu-tRNA(Gln) amidotransferase GatCAB subunit B [Candidatus Nanohalarchaeota archaeon]|nr:MAG: Asp-tRNA(Asn)/Glu-tRNA(Gln) amidotransferase GatCAB subunit B [Candidatus Nanohaloarchaeota archaeon]
MIEDEMISKGVKIGLETHISLPTNSKLFCPCSNIAKEQEEPNTRVCPVCMGHPGTKPHLNRNAVDIAIKMALVFNCKILQNSFFSRKTYFYPDMSKNFQITQYEIPLCEKGKAVIKTGEKSKEIKIRRIHIEEDPAKIVYQKESTYLDYNRCGSPLIEVVTEPDFATPKEARIYLQNLMALLEYLGLLRGGDETTTIKSDANISLAGGNRVEVKNIGGIREVEKALKYEFLRQKNMLAKSIIPARETRGWMDKLGISKSMRSKEFEEDYGYIFEPDLPYICIDNKQIEAQRNILPELPEEKAKRFRKQYGLNEKTVERLVRYRDLADLFEYLCERKIDAGVASSWTAGPILKTLNWNNTRFSLLSIDKKEIYICLNNYINKKHSDFICEKIIQKMVEEAKNKRTASYDTIVKKYRFFSSLIDVDAAIKEVISKNKKIFDEYRGGKEKALNFLVGMVMKETKGAANPQEIKEKINRL